MDIIDTAVIVSVDYAEKLSITLPINRRHFGRVLVVTKVQDNLTPRVATQNRAEVYVIDAHYTDSAAFQKWRAVEEGLDWIGRTGLVCLMDADIVWPRVTPDIVLQTGILYGPRCRITDYARSQPEDRWSKLPLHPCYSKWPQYICNGVMIFHADDSSLGRPPWFDAIKSPSDCGRQFQQHWHVSRRVQLPFNVLHLGRSYNP